MNRQGNDARPSAMETMFWELFDWLVVFSDVPMNHSATPETELAICLPHVIEEARKRHQDIPSLTELRRMLERCRRHRYIGTRQIHSPLRAGALTRVLVFALGDQQAASGDSLSTLLRAAEAAVASYFSDLPTVRRVGWVPLDQAMDALRAEVDTLRAEAGR